MITKLARTVAMISALATLICVFLWLVNGAPNVPNVDFFEGRGLDPYTGHQRFTWAVYSLWSMSSVHRWESYYALLIIAAAATAAALLALLTLLRGSQTLALRYLGTGLGWWSLSLCYLFFFTVVPTFEAFEATDEYLRVGCDVIAFQLLLASSYAFVRFWQSFPRPVSREELNAYLSTLARQQYEFMSPVRKALYRLRTRRTAGESTPDSEVRSGLQIRDVMRRVPRAVWIALAMGAVFIASLGWRVGVLQDDSSGFFATLCLIVLFYSPSVQCARLFKFHRASGSDDDRRKIEWISAALWIALILFLLPAAIMPFWSAAEHWVPDLAFEHGLVGIYLVLAWITGPLIVIGALAMSILYRGSIDPRLALRGFTVWTLLGVVLTLAFVFIERSIAFRLVGWMKLPPQSGYVMAGAIVAATFQPIRRYTEKSVNRFVERVLPETMLASGARKLSAVAVVDISGYTKMSAEDEQGALVASAVVQKEAKRLADTHGGRVVKSTGDGVILAFSDAARALAAVQAIHVAVASRAKALEIADLRLHSGLHWGEVVEMHDGDIYGQTVNVTARIADWARAGELGLSEALAGELTPLPKDLESMGPQTFKNVPQPVVCYRLVGQ